MAMATFGNTPPAVPAGKKGPPAKGKKGVNPFAKKGAAPAKAAPAGGGNPFAKKAKPGVPDAKTVGSMVSSLK